MWESIKGVAKELAGVRLREKEYEGPVTIRNRLSGDAHLVFSESRLPRRTQLHQETIAAGATCVFDIGKTKDFDFLLVVNGSGGLGAARGTVRRNATYSVQINPEHKIKTSPVGSQKLVEEEPAPRRKTDLLASTPGLSFSFSASGWLFVYQLGCAECLQNHGITKNPYVRVSGASGGALTVATMMYGCNMPALRDFMKKCAQSVFKDYSQSTQLRKFLLMACEQVVKDGSYLHPAIKSGRCEVALTEALAGQGFAASVVSGTSKNKRATQFKDSADVVIALLASSSMIISGVAFNMKNEKGEDVQVADGAFTEFLPVIDDNSVKVKPFGDGFDLFGKKAEVQPTEWVPANLGLFPPGSSTIEHLYELGYQDMEAWIENHLAERLEKCKETAGDQPGNLPPVEFTCQDDGMNWYNKVLQTVPITWKEQLDKNQFALAKAARPIRSGWMEMTVTPFSDDAKAQPSITHGRLWIEVTSTHVAWRAKEEKDSDEEQQDNNHPENASGELPLYWVAKVEVDAKDPSVLDLATSDCHGITLKASSPADAQEWLKVFTEAKQKLQAAEDEAAAGSTNAVSPNDVDAKVSSTAKEKKKQQACCLMM